MSGLSTSEAVLAAMQSVLGPDDRIVPLHEPRFEGKEWAYVKECLDTGWVSSAGKFVDRLEKDLAEYTGAAYAIAVVNGTAALHACLLLSGVTSGDEVLVPSLTFVATANAVSYCGAVPHFIDSEERTMGIDPVKLAAYLEDIAEQRPRGCFNSKTGRRISALVPMHTFGHPVDLDPLVEICSKFRIELVEDAAESLGSFYKGRHTGTFGHLAALSFNGNKILTSGGGGAILTNDKKLGPLAKHLTTTAKTPHQWEFNHDMIGYNYRMPNINAALGCAQLEQLPAFLKNKRALAERYAKAFHGIPGVRFVHEPDFCRSNYWLNTILLDEDFSGSRNDILELTHKAGIMTRPAWTLMHRLPMFEGCPRMALTAAESLARRVINIPSSVGLV
jgi:perosamine synthetase